jgi:hypothetical protein
MMFTDCSQCVWIVRTYWPLAHEHAFSKHVVASGKPSKSDLEACWELGATVAAQLMG